MSNIDKRETELLIENGVLVADTLRHLADNEIDSDYFAICHSNENGTEIECELSITDYARQAAGTVDELVKALEAKDKVWSAQDDHINQQADRIESLEKKNGELGRAYYERLRELAELRFRAEAAEKRLTNSESRVRQQNRNVCEIFDENTALRKRIAELEAKLETADKLQDSAFRHGLQHGFSLGQTDDQSGFEQTIAAYSSRGKDNG